MTDLRYFVRRAKGLLDPQTRGFARDSSKLAVGSGVVVLGYGLQIVLITHFLGLGEYGVFAVVVSFVDLVGRFFDFQVGQMTTAFAAETIRSDVRRTAGIAQFSYLVDLGAGVVGFAVVATAAPFAVPHLIHGSHGPGLFVLYGLTMLATTTETTSIALLQLHGRFGAILRLTLVREAMRFALVLAALLATDSLVAVVLALVVLESVMGVAWTLAAGRVVGDGTREVSIWRPALSATRGMRRAMVRMVFHTNVISYVKVLAAQGPTLLLGAMRPPAEVGAFKVGLSIAALVGKPADPAWAAVMPRLAKLRAAGRRDEIQTLIRQTSIGIFGTIAALGVVATVLRDPLLRLVGGHEAETGGSVLVLAVLAQVVNGTLFWNSPLLYAFKRAAAASAIFIAASVLFVPVLVASTDRWGATGAAAALLFWNVVVNVGLSVAAIRTIRLFRVTRPTSSVPAG
jgi:O-antigen/teichoic acid export membrane protein